MGYRPKTYAEELKRRSDAYGFYKKRIPGKPKYGEALPVIDAIIVKFRYKNRESVRNMISSYEKFLKQQQNDRPAKSKLPAGND